MALGSDEAPPLAVGGSRQCFERVYNQGDIAFLDQLTAPEFVSHDRGNPTSDRDGVKQIVGAIKTACPDVAFTADDVIGEGGVRPWNIGTSGAAWRCSSSSAFFLRSSTVAPAIAT